MVFRTSTQTGCSYQVGHSRSGLYWKPLDRCNMTVRLILDSKSYFVLSEGKSTISKVLGIPYWQTVAKLPHCGLGRAMWGNIKSLAVLSSLIHGP